MRTLAAETVGTFALVLFGTGAIVVDAHSGGALGHVGVSLAFGLAVMALVQALGDVSGAHLNPVVSLAFATAGRFPWRAVPGYVAAQLAGAVAASLVLRALFPADAVLGSTLPAGGVARAFAVEVLLTAFLVLVILAVSHGSKERGLLAGITIGDVVGLEALVGGPISGASMNPARSIGPALVSGTVEHLWIYVAAPALGALAAVPSCRWLRPAGGSSALETPR